LLALVLAGSVTFLAYRRLRRDAAHPRLTHVVAAAKNLPEGVALTAHDVMLVDWPAALSLPGSYSKIEQVVGKPLIYPVGAKDPILAGDLGVEGSGIGLSVKIPAGMRATSVRTNEISGVAGFLYPGSHVDVLATFTVSGPPGKAGPVTRTILQNVEVLTAGEKVEPDPTGKPQTVSVVTLLLDPQDSQKLLLASTEGTIQFVLRNGADEGRQTVDPTRLAQLASGVPPLAPVHTHARRRANRRVIRPATKAPDIYLLEVIEGDKHTVAKFGDKSVSNPGKDTGAR
jgi:pilus assembly protein CpaB